MDNSTTNLLRIGLITNYTPQIFSLQKIRRTSRIAQNMRSSQDRTAAKNKILIDFILKKNAVSRNYRKQNEIYHSRAAPYAKYRKIKPVRKLQFQNRLP